jgi:hypothetical protein
MKKVYAQNCFVDEKMDVIPNVSMFWVKMWCQTLLRGCSSQDPMKCSTRPPHGPIVVLELMVTKGTNSLCQKSS